MNNRQTSVMIYLCFSQQDEQYNHLDELEVTRVEKQVNDAMVWMNSKMNQQTILDLTLEPAVKVREIQAKTKVLRDCIQVTYSTLKILEDVKMFQLACWQGLHQIHSL